MTRADAGGTPTLTAPPPVRARGWAARPGRASPTWSGSGLPRSPASA
ncbi:hypothetical protein V2I01_12720 [Micromonospora sp. BRA006-A]|nr:hypothetical protein [Micromonospora sp. BRA006-A]